MNRRGIFCGLAGLLLLACLGLVIYTLEADIVDAQEAAAPPSPPQASTTTSDPFTTADPIELPGDIAAALNQPGKWDFTEATLHEIAEFVRSSSEIDVVIDVRALEDFGLSPDTPITCHLTNISLRAFLGIVLGELDLTHDIRDEALWFTTAEATEGRMSARMYPVADLARVSDDPGETAYDYDSLIELITTSLAPESWEEVGGPGAIVGIYGSLVVDQSDDVHEQLTQFFTAFRQMVREHEENPVGPGSPVSLSDSASRAKIQAALEERTTFNMQDVPLSKAVKVLAESSGIPIVIDNRAFEEFGIGLDIAVTARVKNLPLRFALRRLLARHDLDWTIRHEVLSITTPEGCEASRHVCLYPVYDLVAPPGATGREDNDFDTLISVLTSTVDPDSWDEVGGPGTIDQVDVPPALAITQTEATHEHLRDLLERLRQAKQADREARKSPSKGKTHLTLQTYPMRPGHQAKEVLPLIVRLLGEDAFEGEGVVVHLLGNDLVVRHTSRGHQQIERILMQLRVGATYGQGAEGGGGLGGEGSGGGSGGFGGGFGGGGSF